MPHPFLTARWESLLLLNYLCPPALLEPHVPRGTVLDAWQGRTYVSLVAFLFRGLRVRGIPLPFHQEFEEVNLRFYVRRPAGREPAPRGVVFIRELVPRRAIAAAARLTYNEPYAVVPMSHRVALSASAGGSLEYSWRHGGDAFRMAAEVGGAARPMTAGSEAEFTAEHHWGYTRQRDGVTLQYRVEHPPWQVWEAPGATLSGPAGRLYGEAFGPILAGSPASAHVALGSEVAVYRGQRLPSASQESA